MTDYLAGGQEYLYPFAGDPYPPLDTKVLVLTKGGICTVGYWGANWCQAWLPLPKRNKKKEELSEKTRMGAIHSQIVA